jgi:hypothetical protein
MWELLVLIIIVMGIHWWDYQSPVQEYTFAQPATLDRHDELSTLLREKTPIAVEIGSLPWRSRLAEKATWTVVVESGAEMPVSQWATGGTVGEMKEEIANNEALASEIELTTGLEDLDAGRPWWWLPELRDCRVDVLREGQNLGLSWITAERHWIGCTDGVPVTLWLVHSRYRRYLPVGSSVNPWTITVVDAPWIGRVQYIEVTVKPGWCIGLPAHWGFAARPEGKGDAWIWTANQHSFLSLMMAKIV